MHHGASKQLSHIGVRPNSSATAPQAPASRPATRKGLSAAGSPWSVLEQGIKCFFSLKLMRPTAKVQWTWYSNIKYMQTEKGNFFWWSQGCPSAKDPRRHETPTCIWQHCHLKMDAGCHDKANAHGSRFSCGVGPPFLYDESWSIIASTNKFQHSCCNWPRLFLDSTKTQWFLSFAPLGESFNARAKAVCPLSLCRACTVAKQRITQDVDA